jgi:hypothetical protein
MKQLQAAHKNDPKPGESTYLRRNLTRTHNLDERRQVNNLHANANSEKSFSSGMPSSSNVGLGFAHNFSQVQVKARESSKTRQNSERVQQLASSGLTHDGHPIPWRAELESLFSTGFGDVSIHNDTQASQACDALGATAYTSGNQIAFASSQPQKSLIAHELTHVLQQRQGVHLPNGVGHHGDSYELQAEAVEDAVAHGRPIDNLLATSQTALATTGLQSKSADGAVAFKKGPFQYKDQSVQFDDNGKDTKEEPGSTYINPLNYLRREQRTWGWELWDRDWPDADDFVAGYDFVTEFGQIMWRGQKAWVLDRVFWTSQTKQGISGEVKELVSRYYTNGSNLEFTLLIQLNFKTADVKETSETSVGASLSAGEKSKIAKTESSKGASLSFEKSWGKERTLAGSTFGITREFEFSNQGNICTIKEKYANKPNLDAIADTDSDLLFSDGPYYAKESFLFTLLPLD